ncbi:uncharacterized protein LOC132741133 [Ruditapes philippinarum]|uniref:uncharacterized protein LOC132741133 n=1 Tax=Ruditapes philippinarum TaxID=129788 RepID=UPI00295C0623|nr:uncharacterized protein LOC132741133 [Ruditapes philippinarum]
MNFYLHFLLLATCIPATVYSQSEPRSDGPALVDDSRSRELPTRYLDPRRRIDPLDVYTGTSERSIPYERRSSSYVEDRFEPDRPPYRSSRRRPFPRTPPLGRRYGRRRRRPSSPPRRGRVRPRARRRPSYDPFFREFEPPRAGRRFRPRRTFRPRPRRIRPRGPRRRGPREYYSRDRDDQYRSRDDVAVERSPSFSERRLDDESYIGGRRGTFNRTVSGRPRERLPLRRGPPIRDRRVETTFSEERPYIDARLRRPPRHPRTETQTEFERDRFIFERLPYERLSDRMIDRRTEGVLPPYDATEESRTSYRAPRHRETDISTSDFFDIHNSFDRLGPLDTTKPAPLFERNVPLREERIDSSILDPVPSYKIIQPSSNENPQVQTIDRLSAIADQNPSDLVGTDLKLQADGFINKPESSHSNSQSVKSKPDGFLTHRSNTKSSVTSHSTPNTTLLSETVQRAVLSEEIIDKEPIKRFGKISEISVNERSTAKSTDGILATTTMSVKLAISSSKPSAEVSKEKNIQQNKPTRVVGLSNILSRKHPKFFNIPLPIPKSSLVVNLAKESDSKTTLRPIDVTTTKPLKVELNRLNTLSTQTQTKVLKPKYTEHSSNNIIPVKNNDVRENAETDIMMNSLVNTNAVKASQTPVEIERSHAKLSEVSLSESSQPVNSHVQVLTSKVNSSVRQPSSTVSQRVNKDTGRSSDSQLKDQISSSSRIAEDDLRTDTRSRPLISTRHRGDGLLPRREIRRRTFPSKTVYRDESLVPERDILPADRPISKETAPIRQPTRGGFIDDPLSESDHSSPYIPTRDDIISPLKRRIPSRHYYRDELPLIDRDIFSRERVLRKDMPPVSRRFPGRRRYIPEPLIPDDDTPISVRSSRGERIMSPRRRRPIRRLSSDERGMSEGEELTPVRRRRLPSTERYREELPLSAGVRSLRDERPTRRRRIPSRSFDEDLSNVAGERRGAVGIPARRRYLESDIREAPTFSRRRETRRLLGRERLADRPFREEEEPTRRGRSPAPDEEIRAVPREDEPLRRRSPISPEERLRDVPREEFLLRRRRPPPSEERRRDMPREDMRMRRRRLRTPEERVRAVSREDLPLRRLRLPPHEERLREVPREELPIRRRRLIPSEERPRAVFREEDSLMRRRLPPLPSPDVRPIDETRDRSSAIRDRTRSREYLPPRRRDFVSDILRDGRRPRKEESFSEEPDVSRRRLRPRERSYRIRRLETDDVPVTSIRSVEISPRRDVYDTARDEIQTASTIAPVETTTEERLRLGAVRARGGENGFPVHGGYCPGDRCADGGLAAGVQNGTGTGTLALFLERQRTGENEDIAAYERDLRPRRTTLVV